MAQTYVDLQLKVQGVLQDGAKDLTTEDQDGLIQEAVRRYSGARPRELVKDLAGNGTHDYAVSSLTSWSEGFSVIRAVEFPVSATDVTPRYLEHDDWIEYVTPTARVLRMLRDAPAATQTIRVTYTVLHQADGSGLTVPDGDFDAVANWAASLCCRALANRYAQQITASLSADSVDHQSKSDRYARRAAELWKDVSKALHLSEDETAAGGAIVDWGSGYSFGQGYLTHDRPKR